MIVELDGKWSFSGTTRARGYASVSGRHVGADEIAALLDAADTESSWREKLSVLDGNFAAVTVRGERLWAAVDHVRSFPLFYGLRDGTFVLSDCANRVRDQLDDHSQCVQASAEFLLVGYVTGSDTLFPSVKQIQAGEMIVFDGAASEKLRCRRYFAWRHRDPWHVDSSTLQDRLHAQHESVACRLVASLSGRQVVLPLSGGYDSRLIAVMLKQQKYDNVLCYTYGLPANWEARISESLAGYLKFRWKFVPYSGSLWRNWGDTGEFKDYCTYASNLASIPHVQDWPAIYELRRQGAIDQDAIVVPGHSGDFVAGSHIPDWFVQRQTVSREQLLKTLLNAHYSLWDFPNSDPDLKQVMTQRIEAVSGQLKDGSPADAADQLEYWDMNERQAKFICNSVRVYDFFGLDWRLPLFSRELLDFWSHVPVDLRVGRRLYFDYVDRYQNLPASEPNQDRGKLISRTLGLIKRWGLRERAKSIQYWLRRRNWESVYESCTEPPLAWFTLVNKDLFRRTYTGKQTLHAYLARMGAEGAFIAKPT